MRTYHVYIMTNKWNTVLYTGMTGRGEERPGEHREKINNQSFTARYNVNKLVYAEEFVTPTEAAEAEKKIKGWTRAKKIALIESVNPRWKDLSKGDPSRARSGIQVRIPEAAAEGSPKEAGLVDQEILRGRAQEYKSVSLRPQPKGLPNDRHYRIGDPSLRAASLRNTIVDTLEEPEKHIHVEAGQKLTYILPILKAPDGPRVREIVLMGERSEAEIIGLFLGSGSQALNLRLDTIHAAPNTKGRTEFKAVLAGTSSLEFNGMIKIEKDAQGSNDFLQQDSLLLSEDAKANSVPGLEIEANDVKASHGATAKPVDPEQKFYLMSRGLTELQAEAMIIRGFIAPIFKHLDMAVQERVLHILRDGFQLEYV